MAFVERTIEDVMWDKPGTEVDGTLQRIETVRYEDGKQGKVYLVKSGNRIRSFRGTAKLDRLITSEDLGKRISVKFMGVDSSREVRAGMNPPKEFRVAVEETPDGPVTDADIPF